MAGAKNSSGLALLAGVDDVKKGFGLIQRHAHAMQRAPGGGLEARSVGILLRAPSSRANRWPW